jgi:hypothetical protein
LHDVVVWTWWRLQQQSRAWLWQQWD